MTNFHRLYGLTIEDVCTGSRYESETEVDLSRRQQFLDVAIVERNPALPPPSPLPDGLDNLAVHNLMSYKSIHEAFDDWALHELIGHYVNYRKQLAEPGDKKLLPKQDFRLYAVATRYPESLAKAAILEPVSEGVYEVQCGGLEIRVIVPRKTPDTEANAGWDLFSADPGRVRRGRARYQWRDPARGHIVIRDLNALYHEEGIDMPYTTEDLIREDRETWLHSLPPEELRKALPPEERLKGLPPEERLKGLLPAERLKGLPPAERLKGLPPEERLKTIPPELLKALPEEVVKAWLARQEMETKQ